MISNTLNAIDKKNNQTLVSDVDQEISTLGSTDNAENSVNLVSGIIRLLLGWGFSVSGTDDRSYLSQKTDILRSFFWNKFGIKLVKA